MCVVCDYSYFALPRIHGVVVGQNGPLFRALVKFEIGPRQNGAPVAPPCQSRQNGRRHPSIWERPDPPLSNLVIASAAEHARAAVLTTVHTPQSKTLKK